MVLIDESLIQLHQAYQSKEEVIVAVSKLLDQQGRLYDLDGYIEAVKKREAEVSTNLGDAIAIPHGRCAAVKDASLVFIRLAEPIAWGEEAPVKLIFQIAVPDTAGDLHLQILSKLARKMIYDEFQQQLLAASSEEAVLSYLQEVTGGLSI